MRENIQNLLLVSVILTFFVGCDIQNVKLVEYDFLNTEVGTIENKKLIVKKKVIPKPKPIVKKIKKVKKKKVWLSDTQTAAIQKILGDQIKYNERRVTHYFGLDEAGKPMGVMTIGNEIGRSYPITFMVVINLDGTVKDVEIMVYREPHGWEVRFESFLSQFFGRNGGDPFDNINNITGATLSVRSMTKGVKKAVAEFKVIYKDKVK